MNTLFLMYLQDLQSWEIAMLETLGTSNYRGSNTVLTVCCLLRTSLYTASLRLISSSIVACRPRAIDWTWSSVSDGFSFHWKERRELTHITHNHSYYTYKSRSAHTHHFADHIFQWLARYSLQCVCCFDDFLSSLVNKALTTKERRGKI